MVEFTESEIKAMAESSDVINNLINIHECWATMADAIGYYDECVKFHDDRIKVLTEYRDKLIAEM